MRILFENVLLDASLSAGSASDNYPVTNLIDRFLKKRYQHTAAVYDTVTITLSTSTDIDYFFAGYSNSSQIVVRLYNAAAALLSTDTITSIGAGTKSIDYGQTYSVKSIQIDVYGASGTYLGGVAAGVAETFVDPVASWSEPWEDNTSVSGSPVGQSLRNKRDALRLYTWNFRELTRAVANSYRLLYYTYGLGAIVWIDAFESAEDFIEPMYSILNSAPTAVKNGRRYDMEWSFKEAR